MRIERSVMWAVASMTMVACGSAAPDTDAGMAPDAARVDAGVLDCLGILDCVGACDPADQDCTRACIARGTAEAIQEVTALGQCSVDHNCDDDESCIRAMCPSEVASCTDAEPMIHEHPDAGADADADDAGTDAAVDPFPTRIEGMTRDYQPLAGFDSPANDVFVRDDAAGEANGFPTSRVVFYRLQHIDYHPTVSLMVSGCTTTAESTEDMTDPDAFGNNLMIERDVGADGLHAYGFSIGVHHSYPDGETTVCPGFPTSHGNFSADHYVTHGTMQPRTDLRTFTGSNGDPTGRQRTWDLHRVD